MKKSKKQYPPKKKSFFLGGEGSEMNTFRQHFRDDLSKGPKYVGHAVAFLQI
jgi:hypothetical protein